MPLVCLTVPMRSFSVRRPLSDRATDLLPSHAFIAAAQPSISRVPPVIVDIDPDDWLLSADSIEANITEQTTAIMPVHVNGRLCNMEKSVVAERRGLGF